MLMSNIPRRKIYENLLIFEGGILELQKATFKEENFNQLKEEIPQYITTIKDSYFQIKALLVLLINKQKFETEQDFENEIKYHLRNNEETNKTIKKNKHFGKKFFQLLIKIDNDLNSYKIDIKELKQLLETLDYFNHKIPKILEIPSDKIS